MLICTIIQPTGNYRRSIRRILKLECDVCHDYFQRRFCKEERAKQFHFCSIECRSKSLKNGGIIAAIVKDACLEKYGVTVPSKSEAIKQKMKNTNLERHGVEWPLQNKNIYDKVLQTNLDRYGAENPYNQQSVKDKANSPTACKKRHETMKHNGSYAKSKPEDRVYEILCERFSFDDVERWKLMNNRWPIDFYVKSIDTYIQYDGVYWHGLNRKIKELKSSDKPRDKNIYKKWLIDREQDQWFVDNELRLVRISTAHIDQIIPELINEALK